MINDISILITGNPFDHSGFDDIGHIGAGLVTDDPEWPMSAESDYAMIISETSAASYYGLIFSEALIVSCDGMRDGMLNFQLLLPFDYVISDNNGNLLSPFTFLYSLFERYRELHMTQYPGVKRFRFSENCKMTEEEFADFLKDYRLVYAPLPPRRLNGKGEATIVLPIEKIEQLALDHAYPQLTEFKKLVLCTEGTTSPASLAHLEIPRRAEFEVYVNNEKIDCVFRKGDETFRYTVYPQDPFKLPATITVNLDEGDNKRVDLVNERIDYRVTFKDKTEEKTVTVQLKGCEGNPGQYDRLLKSILNGIVLKNTTNGVLCSRSNVSIPAKTVTFTLKGSQLGYFWSPECEGLPKNVIKEECRVISDKSWLMRFLYEKPVEKPKPTVVKQPAVDLKREEDMRREDGKEPNPVAQPAEVMVPVYIAAADPADNKLTEICRNLTFNMEIHGVGKAPVLAYQDLQSDGRLREKILSNKNDSKPRGCFATEIRVPTIYLPHLQSSGNECIEVESNDDRYVLKARYGRIEADPSGEWFIRVYVMRRSLWQRLLNAHWLRPAIIAVVCLGFGWWIGEALTPWHRLTAKPSEDQVVTDSASGENAPVDSLTPGDSAGIVGGETGMAETETDVASEDDNGGKSVGADENKGVTDRVNNADKVAAATLNEQAAKYLEMIKNASLSFAQVDEIQNWVKANASNSKKINNYSEISSAIGVFKKASDFLRNIKSSNNISIKLASDINSFIKTIPKGGTYKQLRIKMQHLNGENQLDDEKVKEILYEFYQNHPNGITSFSQL